MSSGVARYAIDAGGSHTLVRVRTGDGHERTTRWPSCSIAAVGPERAAAGIADVLAQVRADLAGEGPVPGCLALSSYPVAAEAPVPDGLVEAVTAARPPGPIVLVNDVVPLLWAPPVRGHGVVVVSGTGSAVLARHRDGSVRKLGGLEYVLSDSGSAYRIALAGLREAVLTLDGLGAETELVARAAAFYGRPLRVFAREIAERDRVRAELARFAPEVLDAAEGGDPVAGAVVAREADALGRLAAAAVRQLDLGDTPVIGMSGGVLRARASFRDLVTEGLHRYGLRPRTGVADPVAAALAFAEIAEREGDRVLGPVGGLRLTPGRTAG
jgi:N-acetylglucosamine kinase-like BadF-type ATPase